MVFDLLAKRAGRTKRLIVDIMRLFTPMRRGLLRLNRKDKAGDDDDDYKDDDDDDDDKRRRQ